MLTVINHTGYGVIRIADRRQSLKDATITQFFIVVQSRMRAGDYTGVPINRSWQEDLDLHSLSTAHPADGRPQDKSAVEAIDHLMAKP